MVSSLSAILHLFRHEKGSDFFNQTLRGYVVYSIDFGPIWPEVTVIYKDTTHIVHLGGVLCNVTSSRILNVLIFLLLGNSYFFRCSSSSLFPYPLCLLFRNMNLLSKPCDFRETTTINVSSSLNLPL